MIAVNSNECNVYGSIRFFFESNDETYFIIQRVTVDRDKMFVHKESGITVKHILPIRESNEFILIKAENIESLEILVRVENYACHQPNSFAFVL